MDKFILKKSKTLLLMVDIQEKLAAAMDQRKKVIANCQHLMEAAKLLDLPVMITEQYPRGLSQTVPEIRGGVKEYEPVEKITFDCCKDETFMQKISSANRKTIIVAGMEAHICVLQTCLALLQKGFHVHIISDAVCSRTRDNFETGIEIMRDAGAVISCTETVLFQLLEKAGTQEFKALSRRIK